MSPDLKRVSRRIWWLIGGGAVWFIACTLVLAATHTDTPANELVNRRTMWLFIPSVVMVTTGVYVSMRYWRCPYCGHSLTTRSPIPEACPRCGRDLGG